MAETTHRVERRRVRGGRPLGAPRRRASSLILPRREWHELATVPNVVGSGDERMQVVPDGRRRARAPGVRSGSLGSSVLLDERLEGFLVADRVEPRVREQAFDRPAAGGRQVPIELGDGALDRTGRHEHLACEP